MFEIGQMVKVVRVPYSWTQDLKDHYLGKEGTVKLACDEVGYIVNVASPLGSMTSVWLPDEIIGVDNL